MKRIRNYIIATGIALTITSNATILNDIGDFFTGAADTAKKKLSYLEDEVLKQAKSARESFNYVEEQGQDFFEKTIYTKTLQEDIWKKGIIDTFVKKEVIPSLNKLLLASKISAQTFNNWFGKKIIPEFCTDIPSSLHNLPMITDRSVQKVDYEKLIPYIIKYSPVLYLQEDEIYFPMWVTEWCSGPQTAIKTADEQIITEPGHTSIEAAYELYRQSVLPEMRAKKTILEAEKKNRPSRSRLKEITIELANINKIINWKYSGKPLLTTEEQKNINFSELHFDNPICYNYGSNPRYNKDSSNNLTTPCYVITSEERGNIYIYYTYFYGFNAPYDIGPFTGDLFNFQGAHEADYEHITLELDKKTKELKRIFYAAHGPAEGFWLDAHHPDVTYEGTHPVSFVARGSHADYPKVGTFLRIYGAANDITGKGMRWTPKIVRIYAPEDARFNPKTMGWVCFPGSFGKRDVAHPTAQAWFLNSAAGNRGRDYASAPFCKNPSATTTEEEYASCIASHVGNADLPSDETFI
ncbi:MAG: Vps62-related protein [Candidatus Babeliaceae bacterium]